MTWITGTLGLRQPGVLPQMERHLRSSFTNSITAAGIIRTNRVSDVYFAVVNGGPGAYMVSKWMGIYGKRWICETMNSVIKRKFGDSLRERKEQNKKKITSLMAIAYNIHVIVREDEKNRSLFAIFIYLQQKNVCNEARHH
jgi:hypothetical protein